MKKRYELDDSTQNQAYDFLVIGAGLAGLNLALRLCEKGRVLLIAKGDSYENATSWAQGGLASVSLQEDSFQAHIKDTLIAGDGLCDEEVVRRIVTLGPSVVEELSCWGVNWSHEAQAPIKTQELGPYHLNREGGHSARRIYHSNDQTGREIMRAHLQRLEAHSNLTVMRDAIAVDLITTDKLRPHYSFNRVLGAYVYNEVKNSVFCVRASVTILATGGHGKIYLYSSNPDSATGDGVAMAWRAGAKVANLEFMQFHPTCLYSTLAQTMLISEAVRGEGAVIRNFEGEDFCKKVDPRGSLASRDIVARAIDSELKRSGKKHVFLDFSPIGKEKIEQHFPAICRYLKENGLDPTREWIPVVPAAHYSCGGIAADVDGRTSLSGLFAIGEVASTGFHGANRLASNSLLEACVMAKSAFERICEFDLLEARRYEESVSGQGVEIPEWRTVTRVSADEKVMFTHLWDETRRIMWNYVGIVRSDLRLKKSYDRISAICHEIDSLYWGQALSRELVELRNLAQTALLTVRCAMSRKESRGIHFNVDHPEKNDRYFKRMTLL